RINTMYRITFPFTDTRMVFTPPLESLPGWVQIILLLLGLCVTGGLLLWLYSYEAKLVRPLTAAGLLLLRICVLVLLFFICLQPLISRPASERIAGRVLIALDRSDSMSITDPQRDLPEKLRLAKALNLHSEICKDSQIDDWIKQYSSKGNVNFPNTSAGEADRNLHNQVCAKVDSLTRLQVAQKLLVGERPALINEFAKRHGTEIVGFSQEIGELTPQEIAALY